MRFDHVFLLNRSLHSALVARLARIPTRIGFDTEHRRPLLTDPVPYDWTKPDRDCALDLLRAIGIDAEPALPELWVTEEERSNARQRLKSSGIDSGGLLIGMQPGANDPEVREWGAERFAGLGDRLAAEHGGQVVLFGSKDERAVAERVAARMFRRPVVLAGETTLREALALISVCRLWVGNDGGLLHAAVGLGPATVGIFGPTKASRWGYDDPRHRTMVVMPESPATDAGTIRRCLDAISIESVYAEAVAML